MDINKEQDTQYITMKELSYPDIQPAVEEMVHAPTGMSTDCR